MLVISYASRELAHRCTELELAQEWLGPAVAQTLVDLIADAEALENAQALIDFYGVEMLEDDCMAVAFAPGYRAILKAAGRLPQGANGKLAWAQIRRLILLEVQEA